MSIFEEIFDMGDRDRRNPGEPRQRGIRGLIGRLLGGAEDHDDGPRNRHESDDRRRRERDRDREAIDFD